MSATNPTDFLIDAMATMGNALNAIAAEPHDRHCAAGVVCAKCIALKTLAKLDKLPSVIAYNAHARAEQDEGQS
jgi:hypothetical protein